MRTTLNIDDDLYRQVKATAALRGCSVTSLVEESLRDALRSGSTARLEPMPISARRPGLAHSFDERGIDLNDSSAVLDVVDR